MVVEAEFRLGNTFRRAMALDQTDSNEFSWIGRAQTLADDLGERFPESRRVTGHIKMGHIPYPITEHGSRGK